MKGAFLVDQGSKSLQVVAALPLTDFSVLSDNPQNLAIAQFTLEAQLPPTLTLEQGDHLIFELPSQLLKQSSTCHLAASQVNCHRVILPLNSTSISLSVAAQNPISTAPIAAGFFLQLRDRENRTLAETTESPEYQTSVPSLLTNVLMQPSSNELVIESASPLGSVRIHACFANSSEVINELGEAV
jgi:hypothetical protein